MEMNRETVGELLDESIDMLGSAVRSLKSNIDFYMNDPDETFGASSVIYSATDVRRAIDRMLLMQELWEMVTAHD